MCVCMCLGMCVCMYICIMYVCVCVRMYVFVYVYVCMCRCEQVARATKILRWRLNFRVHTMELTSCHPSGAQHLEMTPIYW